MQELYNTFISKQFLRSVWTLDYEAFKGSEEERNLEARLERWSERTDLKETSAEAALIDVFFGDTWGYVQTGQAGSEHGFTLYPKFSIPGTGAKGGPGEADLAVGFFTKDATARVPQVLCEFKDIRSGLDTPQKRKGNTRSPVKQCLGLRSKRELSRDAPKQLTDDARQKWVDQRFEQELDARCEAIGDRLSPTNTFDASFVGGELVFMIEGVPIIGRIFVDEADGEFILAQWKVIAQTFHPTDRTTGKRFCGMLRKLAVPDNPALVRQIIELEKELTALEGKIAEQERDINAAIYSLYGLSDSDIRLIERG